MSDLLRLYPDSDWYEVIDAIQRAPRIHLITHRLPDSDGIGSQVALYFALLAQGKRVVMHNRDAVPRICRYLSGVEYISHGDNFPVAQSQLMISLDAGSLDRLQIPDGLRKKTTLMNIDHHVSNTNYGDYNFVDARYCATGAMIYDLLVQMKVDLTPAIAQGLYAAILTDTNAFRSTNVSSDLHRLIALLIDAGAKPALAAQEAYGNHKIERFSLLKFALDTLSFRDDQRSAWMCIDTEMFQKSSCAIEDSEGFIEYSRSIGVVDLTVLMCQLDDSVWKVTFRGKHPLNVGELATELGGGGHRYAAGCTLLGKRDDVRQQLQCAVSRTLNVIHRS